MTQVFTLPPFTVLALAMCGLAILVGGYLVISPGPVRLSLARRRPGAEPGPGSLEQATTTVTQAIARLLGRRGTGGSGAVALELAGLKMKPQEFVLLLCAGALAAGAVGVLLAGPVAGVLLAAAVPLAAKLALGVLTSRRQRAFAGQLEDSLQLMSSGLRAGHSLLQSLDGVSQEMPQPTSEEFARIINETRVGRDMGQALDETAARTACEDFAWVANAIAINRQVGGNLAEVLDTVGGTIRERGQIRRQVKALSAEGKLSAIVLMSLPFGVAGFLMVTNPGYLAKLTESPVGYGLIAMAVVLLLVGGLWLRKVTTLKF
jgi:tight adherence protein B